MNPEKNQHIIVKGIRKTKKNKVREFMLPNFQTYYKATVIQIAWYTLTNIQINRTKQSNRNKPAQI